MLTVADKAPPVAVAVRRLLLSLLIPLPRKLADARLQLFVQSLEHAQFFSSFRVLIVLIILLTGRL